MGEWGKWISAGILLMMVVYLYPRAKYMLQNSPKGSSRDWMGFVGVIVVITLFVLLLISMVR